jgi:CRP/FNR family transcriptional regulator, anaerobic regulatory protein
VTHVTVAAEAEGHNSRRKAIPTPFGAAWFNVCIAKELSTMRRSLDDPSEAAGNASANAAIVHGAIAEAAAPAQRSTPRRTALKCPSCSVRHLCLSDALSGVELRAFERMVGAPLGVAEGQTIHTAGSPFEALYIVRTATVVAAGMDRAGCQQILGYHGMGEIVGADGIATGVHSCSTLVTHAGEVCRVPFDELQELARVSPTLQRSLIRALGRSLQSYHSRSLYLGRVSAKQRLVSFLLDLSRQQKMVGSTCFHSVLYLSRVQLSSYLGIRRETLSRVVTQLRRAGVLELAGPFVKLRNGLPLQHLMAIASTAGELG